MQKHRFILALAGFWHVLKLAVGYYILMGLLPLQISQSEKLLFLWFGSPALMAASLFFFPYFRPNRYLTCLDPARLTIGFDAAVAFLIFLYTVTSGISGLDTKLLDDSRRVVYLLCITAIIIDCIILLLLSRGRPSPSQES